MYRCKFCSVMMKSNQARHLRAKHPKAFKQWKESSKSFGETKYSKVVPSHQSARRGWIKDYLKKISEGKYECKICSTILKMPHGIYANMKRHLKMKHPLIYEEEMKVNGEQSTATDVVEYVVEYVDDDATSIDSDEILSAIRGEVKEKQANAPI
ncbi:uncharacterized protein LOC114239882 [Bombyx mandarina]|uniref:Uncharacterized protein LOC114239882 n=1 Tax=Bombyx mandarina TaxID=7092 RepID=A0A6J2JAF9_BOMMA|nr:uncharacterized protein LOC114239882 [Bombyx mandarina]